MADEAVLRIVLQDSGGGVTGGGVGYTAPDGAPSAPTTQTSSATNTVTSPSVSVSSAAFDPVEEAKRRYDQLVRMHQVDIAYQNLFPTHGPQARFDPVAIAKERLEADQRRAAIDAEYAKLSPPPGFDPVAAAQSRLEREQQLAAIDAEYAKIAPPTVHPFPQAFDVTGAAQDQLDALLRRQAVAEEFENLVPTVHPVEEEESTLDTILGVVSKFRGTIGGATGRGIGAGLDVASMAGESGAIAGAAGAAGVVAAAIAIDYELGKLVTGGISKVMGTVGDIGSAIASPNTDPSVPIGRLGEAASNSAAVLFVVNPALGVLAATAGGSATALANLMQNIDKTAERYGEYSPLIAQQQALADVRQTIGDFRRAQEGGPALARYVQAQSMLQQKFEDIKIRLLTHILQTITPMLEMLEKFMPDANGVEGAINSLVGPLSIVAAQIQLIASMFPNPREREIEDPTDVILRRPGGQIGTIPGD